MEQEANPPEIPAWHYEEKGERKGPVAESAIVQLIKDGKLTYGNMVWKKGLQGWTKLEDSDLKVHLNDDQPPPFTGEMVNNTIVWILACAPIIGLILEYMIARKQFPGASDDFLIKQVTSGSYWYITVILNVGLAYFDVIRLGKAGHNTDKFKGMTWLVPVYLYQRSEALKQNKAYFITWILCFILMLFA